jgi:predicted Zn-dependent protease
LPFLWPHEVPRAIGATPQEEQMPRHVSRFIALTAAVFVPLAAACSGRGERQTTGSVSESTAAGATIASTSATAAGSGDKAAHTSAAPATPSSYADADRTFHDGRYEEASAMFRAYTESHPDNVWGHYMLGLSAWRNGDDSLALEAFDAALRLEPAHRKSLFNSARVLLETGRPQDALERVQQALAAEPLSSEGLRLLGRVRYELGQADQAIDAYQRALALDQRDVWAMNNLGYIYIQQGRSTEALPPLARAVELRPDGPVFQNNFATALERSGQIAAARDAYEAALAADSTYEKAAVGLERVNAPGAESDTSAVDVAALSQAFQADVEQWRTRSAMVDSTTADSATAIDSAPAAATPSDTATP